MSDLLDRLRVPDRFRRREVAAIAAIVLVALGVAAALLVARGDDGGSTATPTPTTAATTGAPVTTATGTTGAPATTATTAGTGAPAGSCVVGLHGKGGRGAATTVAGTLTRVYPEGNAAGWGGRQWLYFPEASYTAARTVVADAIRDAGCRHVVIDGFSNGAAFAAKLYCRGETFSGTLVGVKVDDPVTDHAVTSCAPASGVRVVLYWTGALEGDARPGWACSKADWTCEGGTTIGITAYAKALGTAVVRSPNTDHAAFAAAPEPLAWLAGA